MNKYIDENVRNLTNFLSQCPVSKVGLFIVLLYLENGEAHFCSLAESLQHEQRLHMTSLYSCADMSQSCPTKK